MTPTTELRTTEQVCFPYPLLLYLLIYMSLSIEDNAKTKLGGGVFCILGHFLLFISCLLFIAF